MADERTTTLLARPGGTPRPVVRGEVDFAAAPRLREALEGGTSPGAVLTVELRGVAYPDSAGIGVLFEHLRGHRLGLVVAPGSPIARVLGSAG